MPDINASPSIAAIAPSGEYAATPDWDALPNELKVDLFSRLKVSDCVRLANTSRAWRQILVSADFDHSARSTIAEREGVHPDLCPRPPERTGRGLIGEMLAHGFTHAAMLVE